MKQAPRTSELGDGITSRSPLWLAVRHSTHRACPRPRFPFTSEGGQTWPERPIIHSNDHREHRRTPHVHLGTQRNASRGNAVSMPSRRANIDPCNNNNNKRRYSMVQQSCARRQVLATHAGATCNAQVLAARPSSYKAELQQPTEDLANHRLARSSLAEKANAAYLAVTVEAAWPVCCRRTPQSTARAPLTSALRAGHALVGGHRRDDSLRRRGWRS